MVTLHRNSRKLRILFIFNVLCSQAHRRQVQELSSRVAVLSQQLQASQAAAAVKAKEEGVAHARIMELQVRRQQTMPGDGHAEEAVNPRPSKQTVT